jgi:hypothetical protein
MVILAIISDRYGGTLFRMWNIPPFCSNVTLAVAVDFIIWMSRVGQLYFFWEKSLGVFLP